MEKERAQLCFNQRKAITNSDQFFRTFNETNGVWCLNVLEFRNTCQKGSNFKCSIDVSCVIKVNKIFLNGKENFSLHSVELNCVPSYSDIHKNSF